MAPARLGDVMKAQPLLMRAKRHVTVSPNTWPTSKVI